MDNNRKIQENKRHLTRLGSEWGGVHLDLNLIPGKSLIISAGLDDDISLDVELMERKGCFVVGIDPTRVSAKTIFRYRLTHLARRNQITLLKRAVHAKSGLTIRLGGPAKTFLSPSGFKAKTISLDDLILMFPGASVLKLDIEGAEFPALEALSCIPRIPQIAVGFHIWLNSASDQYPNEGVTPNLYTAEDVLRLADKLKKLGYKLVYEERTDAERLGQETLFIRSQFAEKFHEVELIPAAP